ncbi:MAG: hypothetical protein A2042_03140 [Candidatus Schekmanbacteria bacterium GWA2_38_11]|uniref:Uncharacterized protein n=1 Tax=Candidatus Schekmanbacteria bacterium GWA2_38_11 TaxID=1817876 RepID=A0A1F7RN24_9BACT|nr:MAG: hypothetical protein A2042_03140 [Candidatus Schekmanbacteria bacterium GWA2_38_11]
MKNLVRTFLYKEDTDTLKGRLAKGAAGTFALKLIAAGLAFIISVLLARLLGVSGYGIYAYAIAWVNFLVVPAAVGLEKLLIRDIPTYQTQFKWSLMRGLIKLSNQAVLVVSLFIALFAIFISWILSSYLNPQMLLAISIAMVMLPFIALIRIRQATMQGLSQVVLGQLPEMLIQPLLFIILVGCVYLLFGNYLNAPLAIGANAVTTGITFIVGTKMLQRTLPQKTMEAIPEYKTRDWVCSALPLLLLNGLRVINAQADIIILGAIKGAEVAGIYAVANRGAGLITFVLIAVNAALAPTIASLYAAGDMRRLQEVITKSARIILLISLPIGLSLILFGQWFLLLFGHGFIKGITALSILSIGQIVNAATGSVGILLVMTGYERDAAICTGVSGVLNVVLNMVLIPIWGIEGAATATASSVIVLNLLLAIWAYKRLGINPISIREISLFKKIYNK